MSNIPSIADRFIESQVSAQTAEHDVRMCVNKDQRDRLEGRQSNAHEGLCDAILHYQAVMNRIGSDAREELRRSKDE